MSSKGAVYENFFTRRSQRTIPCLFQSSEVFKNAEVYIRFVAFDSRFNTMSSETCLSPIEKIILSPLYICIRMTISRMCVCVQSKERFNSNLILFKSAISRKVFVMPYATDFRMLALNQKYTRKKDCLTF